MNRGFISAVPEQKSADSVMIKPAAWLNKIDFVKQLILSNNILISFLSEEGSGKTTFAHMLQADLDLPPAIQSFLMSASPKVNRVQLLNELGLLIDSSSKSSMAELVAHNNDLKTHLLVVIDDAHFLPASLIGELLQALHAQTEAVFFHVCLMGDVSLAPCLNQLANGSYVDMIHNIELGLLTENETKTYVMQNMMPAPGAEKMITDERMAQFYQLTEGKLSRINCLMTPFFSHKPQPVSHHLRWLLHGGIAASVVLAATVGAYVWLTLGLQAPPPQIEILASADPIDEPLNVDLRSVVLPFDEAVVRQAIEATSMRRLEMTKNGDDLQTAILPEVVVDKVVVAPKVISANSQGLVTKPKKQAILVRKVAVIPVLAKTTALERHYTIQIMAGHNKRQLISFAKAHHLESTSQIRQMQRAGLQWYVLTIGEYAAHDPAKRAVSQLPKDIAQFRPWVRSMADFSAG